MLCAVGALYPSAVDTSLAVFFLPRRLYRTGDVATGRVTCLRARRVFDLVGVRPGLDGVGREVSALADAASVSN